MEAAHSPPTAPLVVAVFDTEEDTAQGLEALRQAGVQPEQVSLMITQQSTESSVPDGGAGVAGGAASGATVGGLLGGLAGGLLGLAALAIPGIGPVLGVGVLASLLTGAAVGAAAGGLLGGLVGLGVPEHEALTYESHVREGRVLLTVQPGDPETAERLRAVLEGNNAYDVGVYAGSPTATQAASPVSNTVENTLEPLDAPPDLLPDRGDPAGGGSRRGVRIEALANWSRRKPAPAPAERGPASARPAASGPGAPPAVPPDPGLSQATATPFRGAGDAARAANPAALRVLAQAAGAHRGLGDRGPGDPAPSAPPDRGPRGTDTVYRSGGAGSRGEAQR